MYSISESRLGGPAAPLWIRSRNRGLRCAANPVPWRPPGGCCREHRALQTTN